MLFISYSHDDRRFVSELALELNSSGQDVWLDVSKHTLGSDLWGATYQAIKECDVFVLVASRSSLASESVKQELSVLASSVDETRLVISVLIDGTTSDQLPPQFQNLLHIVDPGSARVVASRISNECSASTSESPSVWLKMDMGSLRHPLRNFPKNARRAGPIMMLGNDYEHLSTEFLNGADPSKTWLTSTLTTDVEATEAWISRVRQMPNRVRGVESVIRTLIESYLRTNGLDDIESRYARELCVSAIRHLLFRVTNEFEILRYLTDSNSVEPDRLPSLFEHPQQPFHGLHADVMWDSWDVRVACPPYVQEIDLIVKLPASVVLLPEDAGKMMGDSLAARMWVTLNAKPRDLMTIPPLTDLTIGPA